ncbi:MAG: signal peptide peptidase SppA [Bacteroidota bacterium]
MLQFFKYVLATLVGLILFVFLFFFIIIGIGSNLSSSDTNSFIAENTVLKLNLNRTINDNEPADDSPFKNFESVFNGNQPEAAGLAQIKRALANAKIDPKIKGIYLESTMPMTGYANLEEVREALIDFKKSGKFIIAYGEYFVEKGYYLAAVADKIYLNPAGIMDFNGLSADYTFFKGTLDKLEIKPLIYKVGTFKSAVEPFLLDKMSEANRLQTTSFLGSINNHVFTKIAEARGLSVQQVRQTADSLIAFRAKGALSSKLVTNLGYYTDVEKEIKQEINIKSDDKIKFINISKYLKTKLPIEEKYQKDKIAILSNEGQINSGKGSSEMIGSDTFVEEITKLRNDKNVKAIVLRINSPGGSALASDVMWNEVQQTRKVKPVIASFGDYAASGGYYMGMGADAIVAEPTTITGSIGIFMILFNSEKFLKNKLGVTTDYVGTNANSDFPSVTREPSAFESKILQNSTNEGYETFTSKAAQGRKMSIEKLKSLAEGRVWSGIQAKENGLVDELGGIDKAIKLAAKKAKLKDGHYSVKYTTNKKSAFEELFSMNSDEAEGKFYDKMLGKYSKLVKKANQFTKMEGLMARMEFDMELK